MFTFHSIPGQMERNKEEEEDDVQYNIPRRHTLTPAEESVEIRTSLV